MFALTVGGLFLAACAGALPQPTSTPPAAPSPSTTVTPSPTATRSPTPGTPTSASQAKGPWENYPAPQLTPVTPVPPPLTGLTIPDEVRVLAIAGIDEPLPFSGRTDAIALVIYHPRLARASVISIPPDLFGYIPGYTMQRLYTAYAIGGARLLNDTLAYNLGIRPDYYAVFNLNSFSQLIDDLGGINVTVLEDVRKYCPDIPPGVVYMDGKKALCYMRLRLDEDETARNRRQQEIFRTVFLRLVENGNLIRVPELYQNYRDSIDSNLTREELLSRFPLALKLGDPKRIGYFQMGDKELRNWQISQQPITNVFLPNRPALMRFMQQAISYVSNPSPLSEVVVTLEYQLTVSPTPTTTSTVTLTPSRTPVPTRTFTPGPSPTITRTPTVTPTRSPTFTLTPTENSLP